MKSIKQSIHNWLLMALPLLGAVGGALSLSSCSDDELPSGNPVMDVKTDLSTAHFGDSLHFIINASDKDVPLSTIHAQLYFDSELVAEEVIRTKVSGQDYEGKIYVPYYANIPAGNATLRLSLQNINFTRVEKDCKVAISHPDFPYLTFVSAEDGKEYNMERKAQYVYEFTQHLPQTIKGYIHAPKVGDNGNPLVFGFENNAVKVGAESPIPFSNTKAGKYTVAFNTFSFTPSPCVSTKINGMELEPIDDTHSKVDLNLQQGQTITIEDFPNFNDWWIDPDYFTSNDDGTLTFLPIGGNYRIIVDQNLQYLRVYALTAGNPATLANDGSGALWVIGDNVGKPSLSANTVGWTTEKAICMAQVSDKVHQITLVGGKTVSTNATNFKFFGQMGWGVELKGSANFVEVNSSLIGVGDGNGHDDGNLYLLNGQKLKDNVIYRFTVDLTAGINAAKLTVTEEGEMPFEEKKVFLGSNKMQTNDNIAYQIDTQLAQGSELEFSGVKDIEDYYLDPDYFSYDADDNIVTFSPLDGLYRIKLNVVSKTLMVHRLNSDGTDATLTGDGHGIWLMGWGVGCPSQDSQFGWTPGAAYCLAEVEPGIYHFTGNAGPEKGSVTGDRFRTDYLSFKFFHQNGWGGEFSGDNALTLTGTASQFIKNNGNFELANGVQLEQGATYMLVININNSTIDMIKAQQ